MDDSQQGSQHGLQHGSDKDLDVELSSARKWDSSINLYKPSFAVLGDDKSSSSDQDLQLGKEHVMSKNNFYSPSFIQSSNSSDMLLGMSGSESKGLSFDVDTAAFRRHTIETETITKCVSSSESDDNEDCNSLTSLEFLEIPGSWGTQLISPNPWDELEKPVIQAKKLNSFSLTKDEEAGVLTDRIIGACSSYLDKCPETNQYVMCKVNLSDKGLTDISIIMFHHYLQYVNLANNEITNLKPLGQLPFLMHLNVSNNKLTTVLDFKPPFNLSHVNFSHNLIEEINDLTEFWSLLYLDLSHNSIMQISGVNNLKYLKHLNLADNKIMYIENLENMNLETLNLQHNEIVGCNYSNDVGLNHLNMIIKINLNYNKIPTLKIFRHTTSIQWLELKNNRVSELFDVLYLKNLQYLTNLNLTENPITKLDGYWEHALACIPSIVFLDDIYIDPESKVLAFRKYRSTKNMVSNKMCADTVLFYGLKDHFVSNTTIPIDQPPPTIVILVGPPGSKKQSLIKEVLEDCPFAVRGVSHTTRTQFPYEVDGVNYHFIKSDEYDRLVDKGYFFTSSDLFGESYGFALNEIDKGTDSHKIVLIHMNLTGALTLRSRAIRPYLILTIPSSEEVHRLHLNEKYCFTRVSNIDNASKHPLYKVSRIEETITEHESAIEIAKLCLKECVDAICGSTSEKTEMSSMFQTVSDDSENSQNVSRCYEVELNRTMSGLKTPEKSKSRVLKKESTLASWASSDMQYQFRKNNLSLSETVFLKLNEESLPDVLSKIDDDPLQSIENLKDPSLQTDLEKAVFINEVINTRRAMIEFHLANPGIFCETVFSDHQKIAVEKIKAILQLALHDFPKAPPIYEYKVDPLYNELIEARIKTLTEELDRSFHNSDPCK